MNTHTELYLEREANKYGFIELLNRLRADQVCLEIKSDELDDAISYVKKQIGG